MAGQKYHIYCDESCTDRCHSHMVFGGIMLPAATAKQLASLVGEWRVRKNMTSELKWQKITTYKFAEYKEYVHGIMRHIHRKEISFRSVVFDKQLLDYKTFHAGNRELGFYKLWFQFLNHCFLRRLFGGDTVIIFLDRRDTAYRLGDLQSALNTRMVRHAGWAPVRKIEPIDSKRSEIMQMADVLMGAIGHQNNQLGAAANARISKVTIANYIAHKAGLPNLRVNTPQSATHFGIWQFRLRTKKAP